MKKLKLKSAKIGTDTIYSKENFLSLANWICTKKNLYFYVDENEYLCFCDENELEICSFRMNKNWYCYNWNCVFFIEIKDNNYVDYLLDFYLSI
jgi:hypothetical protein